MIIPKALACVAVIFASILQYQNGGLLNVFMKPVPPTGGQNGTSFDIQSDFSGLNKQVMKIMWGKLTEADLAVLAALPPDLGGGEEGVKVAIANPNREGQIIVTFIVCLVFASLGLLAIFIFSLVCCCCSSPGDHHGDDESEKSSVKGERGSNISTEDQNCICCGLHLLALIMTTLLLIGLAVCIGFYFGAAKTLSEAMADSQATDEEVVLWLDGNSSSISIGRTLQFFVSNVFKFGNSSIASAKTNINATVVTVKTTLLEKTLPKEISTLVAALLTNFKVTEIKNALDDMVYAIGNVSKHADFIWNNYNTSVLPIAKNSTKLNEILESVKAQCNVPAEKVDALKNKFDPTNVRPVPEELTTLLNKTDGYLKDLQSKLENITEQLEDKQKDVMDQLQNKVDLTRIQDRLNKLMGGIEEQFNQVSVHMDTMTTKVSGILGQYSRSVKAGLYALGLPCILAGIVFILFLALFLSEAFQRHLFSITGESASEVRGAWTSRSRVGGGGMFCICSALLLVPIILVGLVALLTVTIGGFLHAELCPYVANSSGIRMTDYVANSKIEVMWDNLIPSGGAGTGGNDFAGILNLKAPQNPLYAIEVGCDPRSAGPTKNAGLLVQLGIDNLVNTSALLESPLLTEGISNAKTTLVDKIADAKLGNEIPNDTIAKLQFFTKTFQTTVQALNLSTSIQHLKDNLFKTNEIEALANKLLSTAPCNEPKDKLLKLVPELKDSNAASTKIRKEYEGLNNSAKAVNTAKLETGIDSFQKSTTDKESINETLVGPLDDFTKALIGSVNETGNEAFANLTQNLLPCGSLYYAFNSVVFMGCGPAGLAPRVFAWGLFLSLCLFFTFFSLLSLCLLWRVQNHQVKRFGGSGYSDDDDIWSEY